jgi:hypothetical protein
MSKKLLHNRIKRLVKVIYLKLFRINDSPAKIALGFGLGVFIGVMPGVGPVIALLLAMLLRVNRASALLGSILFNTWVGFITLLFAVKIGSSIMGLNYQDVYAGWMELIKNFKWEKLFEVPVFKILVPTGIGYVIISLILATITTVIIYLIAKQIKSKKKFQVVLKTIIDKKHFRKA